MAFVSIGRKGLDNFSKRLKALPGKVSGFLHSRGRKAAPPLNAQAIKWAFRFFLGREPRNRKEIAKHAHHADIESLRRSFVDTVEFRTFLSSQRPWAAPLFLLARPVNSAIPFMFSPPSLATPTSQMCTEAQFHEEAHRKICNALAIDPAHIHRKTWEFVWIIAGLRRAGLLRPGIRALGFGVGNEPLPAFFARLGMEVLATDAPQEAIAGQGWDTTGQHAAGLEQLWHPKIVGREHFDKHVSFAQVDMNAIPANLGGFDFCWSSCCFEHLGSIEKGLDFVCNSLSTVKPGGLVLHTTEFNLTSNDETFEDQTLSLFRRRDIEALYARLIEEGHKPWPINFYPGMGEMDAHVDLPPFATPHLKIQLGKYVSTSIGLAVQKAAS
ncbi:MAG: class I SAM-dependent methyltransferase [Alphaproteobacteria bacterium]